MGRATAGASQIYCVRRAERSDSATCLAYFWKIYPYYSVFGGLFIIVFDFFVLKNGRGAGGEFHFLKLLIYFIPLHVFGSTSLYPIYESVMSGNSPTLVTLNVVVGPPSTRKQVALAIGKPLPWVMKA